MGETNNLDQGLDLKVNRLGTLGWVEGEAKFEVTKYKVVYYVPQGMVDGSASKPALIQDTGYMVEKTYLAIAPYLGAFGAYLMPQ